MTGAPLGRYPVGMLSSKPRPIPPSGIAYRTPLDPHGCAPLLQPMPRRELRVAKACADFDSVEEVAQALGLTFHTTRLYVHEMSRKIPGTLPAFTRVKVWARGATLTVLQGHE